MTSYRALWDGIASSLGFLVAFFRRFLIVFFLCQVQNPNDFLPESWKVVFHNIPDDFVVHNIVAVNQNIAEADNALVILPMRFAVSGLMRDRRLRASPIISNWRSTAERSKGSAV